ELAHVRRAVAADVVHAQVEHVRAVAGLVPGDLDTPLEVPGKHRLPERLRSVGVGPLADHQDAGVLPERDVVVDGRNARLSSRLAFGGAKITHGGDDLPDVLRRSAAAAAHHAYAVLGDEPVRRLGEL